MSYSIHVPSSVQSHACSPHCLILTVHRCECFSRVWPHLHPKAAEIGCSTPTTLSAEAAAIENGKMIWWMSVWRVDQCPCAVKPVVPRCSVPEAVTVGTSTELRCLENEGFPAPQYRWFHNDEELPQDSKTSPKFVNSSYSINPDTGGLVRLTGAERQCRLVLCILGKKYAKNVCLRQICGMLFA